MELIKRKKNELFSSSAVLVKPMLPKIAQRILKLLAEEPLYPREIARRLGIDQQKIYYHIRKLKKAGFVKVERKEDKMGALTKVYSLRADSFVYSFGRFKKIRKLYSVHDKEKKFLEPFVKNGRIDVLFVVGSPDPHGEESARARDAYYAVDLALFFGSFLTRFERPVVKLDTDMRRKDMKNNLILIGGPIINKITNKVNKKLPIFFHNKKIYSKITRKTYTSDNSGIIVKMPNPYQKTKIMLVIAGKRHFGTKAGVLAFLHDFNEICSGNRYRKSLYAKVVQGMDSDSDGVIDSVKFWE